jgi:hypothetical protein
MYIVFNNQERNDIGVCAQREENLIYGVIKIRKENTDPCRTPRSSSLPLSSSSLHRTHLAHSPASRPLLRSTSPVRSKKQPDAAPRQSPAASRDPTGSSPPARHSRTNQSAPRRGAGAPPRGPLGRPDWSSAQGTSHESFCQFALMLLKMHGMDAVYDLCQNFPRLQTKGSVEMEE